jgi:hypothetical protein
LGYSFSRPLAGAWRVYHSVLDSSSEFGSLAGKFEI